MGKGWKAAGKLEAAQKKGAQFTKLAREIAVAAKLGGGDPEANSRLKLAIIAARRLYLRAAKDLVERSIEPPGVETAATYPEIQSYAYLQPADAAWHKVESLAPQFVPKD